MGQTRWGPLPEPHSVLICLTFLSLLLNKQLRRVAWFGLIDYEAASRQLIGAVITKHRIGGEYVPKNKTKSAKRRTQIKPKPEQQLTADQAKKVKGGIGLLVPAVQKVREAAAAPSVDVETQKLNP